MGSLRELHYSTLELRNRDALIHFYSNQTIGFPSIVMLKYVKIWSCLKLGRKVKNRYKCAYFSEEQVFSKASCHSFNSVPQPGHKQGSSMLLLGDIYKQLSLCQCPGDPFPTSLLSADTQICLRQRTPKLPKHLLPQQQMLQ